MMAQTLSINDVHVTELPVCYTCHGLGSCIGVFVTDRTTGLNGGAHIPLSAPLATGDFLDASVLIEKLLNAFAAAGSKLDTLRAKLVGGAQLFENGSSVGERNGEAVLRLLRERKIFVAATDIGGKISRTARFNSVTGDLMISTSESKTYCI